MRSQKVEESLVVCDEVLASKPTDESTLGAMMHVLRGLGRREYRESHLLARETNAPV